jgi:hypothetical protein
VSVSKLNHTQQTISNDFKYPQKKAIDNFGRQTEQAASDYQSVLSNLYSIRKEAWALHETTKDNKVKVMLYNMIANINMAIMQVRSTGDILEQEALAEGRDIFCNNFNFCRTKCRTNSRIRHWHCY